MKNGEKGDPVVGKSTVTQKIIMEEKDKNQIKKIVNEYQDIWYNVDLMQKSILGLANKRDKLISVAESLKQQEKTLIDSLIEKYGSEAVTPNKLLKILESK